MADEAGRRNIAIPQSMWDNVVEAAAREQIETGERVSISEWIRRAIRERLARRVPTD